MKALPFHPSVYDSKTATTYLAAEGEWYASTLNDSGLIAGHFTITAADKAFPYYWDHQNAAPTAITLPPGFHYAEVYGVNAAGLIVGTMWENGDDERAFIFDVNRDSVARDLNAVTLLAPEVTLRFAVDINTAGAIVGYGAFDGQERGFLLTAYAPEIAISPNPQANFGTIEVETSATRTFTLSNEGNGWPTSPGRAAPAPSG